MLVIKKVNSKVPKYGSTLNHFAVEVEDWDGWFANLSRMGIVIDQEPRMNYSKLSGFVKDPDGHRIKVMQFGQR